MWFCDLPLPGFLGRLAQWSRQMLFCFLLENRCLWWLLKNQARFEKCIELVELGALPAEGLATVAEGIVRKQRGNPNKAPQTLQPDVTLRSGGRSSAFLGGRVVSAHGYHQMGPHEILRLSTQRESIERSRDRCKPCPEAAKRLLRELGESRAFWFALRRHGTSELCLRWLQKMTEHSSWATDRHSENEILRKEYLRFWQEVRDYRPNFQDEEMKRRQRDAGTVQAVESSS